MSAEQGGVFDCVVRNTSAVVTCDGEGTAAQKLKPIAHGAVGISAGKVAWLGEEKDLNAKHIGPQTRVLDAAQQLVGPGFVDPHTHVVFAGERSNEFALRCRGATYLEIAASGGGIASTVKATRAASEDELVALALPRLERLRAFGVTTCEVKSGYGLDVSSELKMLRVIRRLSSLQPIRLVPTLLCLHALPPERKELRERYIDECLRELLPEVASKRLAIFCDVFVEQSAFTKDEARHFLEQARGLGLIPRLHVDQLTAGNGAELAAELGASSADHLEHISHPGIEALASAKVVAVLAPTSTLFIKARHWAPGRALADAGVPVALCTNINPGSAMSENVSLAMGLSCLENGLTPDEAFLGFTRVAAQALRLEDAGRLKVGGRADLLVFDVANVAQLPYHLGVNCVRQVMINGAPLDSARGERN